MGRLILDIQIPQTLENYTTLVNAHAHKTDVTSSVCVFFAPTRWQHNHNIQLFITCVNLVPKGLPQTPL